MCKPGFLELKQTYSDVVLTSWALFRILLESLKRYPGEGAGKGKEARRRDCQLEQKVSQHATASEEEHAGPALPLACPRPRAGTAAGRRRDGAKGTAVVARASGEGKAEVPPLSIRAPNLAK